MNTKSILRLALTALAFLLAHTATAAPLSGTKSIAPAGDYASIGAAIVDIQTQTLGGALVLELQSAYLGSVETFPLVFAVWGRPLPTPSPCGRNSARLDSPCPARTPRRRRWICGARSSSPLTDGPVGRGRCRS